MFTNFSVFVQAHDIGAWMVTLGKMLDLVGLFVSGIGITLSLRQKNKRPIGFYLVLLCATAVDLVVSSSTDQTISKSTFDTIMLGAGTVLAGMLAVYICEWLFKSDVKRRRRAARFWYLWSNSVVQEDNLNHITRMVVDAASEAEARQIAATFARDEGAELWRKRATSECEELVPGRFTRGPELLTFQYSAISNAVVEEAARVKSALKKPDPE
jgi:hypothetical protein